MQDEELATEHLAVLGSPIAHSKSPGIHAAAYRELGLAWAYSRFEVDAAGLRPFLEERRNGWRGFSLTMPLKEEAHRQAAILDPVAIESGVVNTLLRLDSETSPWAGFNTDVGGLASAIRKADLPTAHTVILGAGATAVSAVLAARKLGAERITVLARRPEARGALVSRFHGTSEGGRTSPVTVTSGRFNDVPDDPSLVIATLPGAIGEEISLSESLLSAPLFDVAYEPWPSPLAERWRMAGGRAHAGTDMLVEQALLQLRIFVGGDPAARLENESQLLAVMRAAAQFPGGTA